MARKEFPRSVKVEVVKRATRKEGMKMETPCYWVRDKRVPGGKYLVPGCISRAVYGDHAPCRCTPPDETDGDQDVEQIVTIGDRLDKIEEMLKELLARKPA